MTNELGLNTDKEIWRRIPEDYYSPSIHVTQSGDIGINVGGFVIEMPIEDWHKLGVEEVSPDDRYDYHFTLGLARDAHIAIYSLFAQIKYKLQNSSPLEFAAFRYQLKNDFGIAVENVSKVKVLEYEMDN